MTGWNALAFAALGGGVTLLATTLALALVLRSLLTPANSIPFMTGFLRSFARANGLAAVIVKDGDRELAVSLEGIALGLDRRDFMSEGGMRSRCGAKVC